ncbi:hypothetical protein LTR37_001676 [Vermiconidia calcicola]|uniref:Uncharacterized protein n=1 Tax=Vermiconidia calcicola TaxID=1690605 RepID=A0ACC3NVD8_9PEZI|nr:hypothetical protein LTR37_001676 [Vermiconidia calcicola]
MSNPFTAAPTLRPGPSNDKPDDDPIPPPQTVSCSPVPFQRNTTVWHSGKSVVRSPSAEKALYADSRLRALAAPVLADADHMSEDVEELETQLAAVKLHVAEGASEVEKIKHYHAELREQLQLSADLQAARQKEQANDKLTTANDQLKKEVAELTAANTRLEEENERLLRENEQSAKQTKQTSEDDQLLGKRIYWALRRYTAVSFEAEWCERERQRLAAKLRTLGENPLEGQHERPPEFHDDPMPSC